MALTVADKLAILDLAAAYNHAVDGDDAEGVAALFAEDGVIDAVATGRREGRAAIVEYFRAPRSARPRRHWNCNQIIEGDGDRATLRQYLMVVGVQDPPKPLMVGRYEDTLRKQDGAWRFVERRIIVDAPAS